jgi:hypothetical protein
MLLIQRGKKQAITRRRSTKKRVNKEEGILDKMISQRENKRSTKKWYENE